MKTHAIVVTLFFFSAPLFAQEGETSAQGGQRFSQAKQIIAHNSPSPAQENESFAQVQQTSAAGASKKGTKSTLKTEKPASSRDEPCTSHLVYDFRTKDRIPVKCIRYGETIVFEVSNINRRLYDVTIEVNQTNVHSDPAPIFQRMMTSESVGEAAADASAEGDNAIDEINKLQGVIAEYDEQLGKKGLNENARAEARTRRADARYRELLIRLRIATRKVVEAYKELERVKKYYDALIDLSEADGLAADQYRGALEALSETFSGINSSEDLSRFNNAYRQFNRAVITYTQDEAVKHKFGNDAQLVAASVNDLVEDVQAMKRVVEATDYSEVNSNINRLKLELLSPAAYSVVSNPVRAERDLMTFTVKIRPRSDIPSSPLTESREFEYPVYVKGGWRFDFSTGLTTTFGLYDRSYSVVPVEAGDDTKVTIMEDGEGSDLRTSLTALMHVGPRWVTPLRPSLTFGVGLNSTDIAEASFLLGGSIIFGSENQFILSGGVAMATVDELDGKFKTGAEYDAGELPETITERVFKQGWFVAVSYNLTGKKRE